MFYASVCSGIEGASVAWSELGWVPVWFSEVDGFCSSVLRAHHPEVSNLGDLTRITAAVSLLEASRRIAQWMQSVNSTSSSAEPPASRSALPACEKEWMTLVVNSPTHSFVLSLCSHLAGSSGRTSPAFCIPTEEGILVPSSGGWQNAGMGGLTESLTLRVSEFPNVVAESSLWDIIEEPHMVPPQSYLSPQQIGKMAARLERNKKKPPEELARLFSLGTRGTKPPSFYSENPSPSEPDREEKELG